MPIREPQKLKALFDTMGFTEVARHRSKDVTLWRQGLVNFVVKPSRIRSRSASRPSTGLAPAPWRSAWSTPGTPTSARCRSARSPARSRSGRWNFPFRPSRGSAARCSISSTATATTARSGMSTSAGPASAIRSRPGVGLHYIDHLTHNVHRGRMDHWAGFYEKLFNFKQIRFFNIEGKLTGLISRAMTRPCGKIRIPINESLDDKSQIEEYLKEYHGEGIQHVAMGARDIYESVAKLAGQRHAVHAAAARHLLREGRCARAGPRRAGRKAAPVRHPDRRRGRGGRRRAPRCCCRFSPPRCWARSFSSSSSARATRASARAISARCSNRSKRTKSGAGVLQDQTRAYTRRAPPSRSQRSKPAKIRSSSNL